MEGAKEGKEVREPQHSEFVFCYGRNVFLSVCAIELAGAIGGSGSLPCLWLNAFLQ